MHGRKLLVYFVAASDAELCILHYVYGGYEYPECNHCGIHVKLYGNRASARTDFLGKHALECGQGAYDTVLVDHPDSGCFSGGDTDVHDQYWE